MPVFTRSNPAERGKRDRSKAANRDAILVGARRAFAEVGFESTTVRDIVRNTDLASGTFYNYFKSKDEVFEALAADSVRRFRPVLAEVRKNATGVEAYVAGAFGSYFGFLALENEEALHRGQSHLAMIGVRADTPEMQAIYKEIRDDLEDVLKDGALAGVDLDYLTAAAIGIAREVGDQMLRRTPLDPDAAGAFATTLLMSGIERLPAKTYPSAGSD